MDKLLSGRYLLTVCCGTVFVYCSFNEMLPKEFIADMLKLVVIFYFLRQDREVKK